MEMPELNFYLKPAFRMYHYLSFKKGMACAKNKSGF
jgi:hypothetical protein